MDFPHQARAILETLTSNPIQTRELEMAINQKLGLDDGNQQLDEEDIDNIESGGQSRDLTYFNDSILTL